MLMRTRNLYGLIMDPHRILNGIGIPSSHRNGDWDGLVFHKCHDALIAQR